MVSTRQSRHIFLGVAAGAILLLYFAITSEYGDATRRRYLWYDGGFHAIGPSLGPLSPHTREGTKHRNNVVTHTTIPGRAHSHGFTVFDELYLRNGIFYVLTSDPSSFPPRENLIGRPLEIGIGLKLEPTDNEMQFIDPAKAKEVLGDHAIRIQDLSVIVYDPDQFMHHFYHWWGEIILGFWRVYSTLSVNQDGSITPLPFPARFLLPFAGGGKWRDNAGVDGPLMRAVFPYASIEESDHWEDLLKLDVTVVFDRAMIINRDTAHRHSFGGLWYKMIAGTMNVTAPDGFWEPVRESLIGNLFGNVPKLDGRGILVDPPQPAHAKPLVTYISRQASGRHLLEKDHEGLVQALKELESEGICEVRVAQMERMSLRDQLELISRSTVLLGVHGNGLTHQLWMPPSPVSTVIEIFIPDGYVFDYEILARNRGFKHYAVWNDTFLTYPKGQTHQGLKYPPGFHGIEIPVYGPTVAQIIRERLRPPP